MVEDLGGLVTCGADSAIVIFEYPFQVDPSNKERIIPRRKLVHGRGHQKGVKCFKWVKSHKLVVSGGLEREVIVWNPYTCKPVVNLEGHQAGISRIVVNAEFEQFITLSMDGMSKVRRCRLQTPDTRHQTLDPRHQTPDTRHQTPESLPQPLSMCSCE
jgi:WD40 repeat protein